MPVMAKREKLLDFIEWRQKRITGYVKDQAQISLYRLIQFLALNLEVAAEIEKGETVTALGVPKNYPDPRNLVTSDCIMPPQTA